MDDEKIKAFEGTVEGPSKNGFNLPVWTYPELARTVIEYALSLDFGDRVTCKIDPIQVAEKVIFTFYLDNLEIGRVDITLNDKALAGYSYSVRYTANKRSKAGEANPNEIQGIQLFYEIVDDLESYLLEVRGLRPRLAIRPAKTRLWKEINTEKPVTIQKIESEKADRNKGGAPSDPLYNAAWNERKSNTLTFDEAYKNYLNRNGLRHSKGERDKFRNAMNYRDRKAT